MRNLYFSVLFLAACGYQPTLVDAGSGGPDGSVSGPAAALVLDTTTAVFGDVVVGQTSTTTELTVRNSGDAPVGPLALAIDGHVADFTIIDDACSGTALAPHQSCTLSIAFAPTHDGDRAAVIALAATPGGSARASLGGRGLRPCELAFDTSTADFGEVLVTASSPPRTLVLSNTGQAISDALVVTLPSGAPYVLSADTCSGTRLPGGATCSVTGRFAPTAVGTATASLSIGVPPGCVTAASFGGSGAAHVTVARGGAGTGTVTSDPAGIDCGAGCAHDFTAANVTLSAAAPAGHSFVGWSGACSGTGPCALALVGAAAATASFEPDKVLSIGRAGTGTGRVVSTPAGIDCGAQCTAAFGHGAVVTLSATPAADASFAGWTGACAGSGACTVTMDAARTVGATFELLVHPLSVTVAGSGSVTAPGIACPGDCAESYPHGTTVSLAPSAAPGWVFNGWSGACSGLGACQVAMTATRAATATFVITTPSLAVVRLGTGTGTVTSSPGGIACGATCSHGFTFGDVVTLSAVADPGSSFTGWSGACSGLSCTVTVDAARSVEATFAKNRQPLTVTLAGAGLGTVTSAPGGITCGTACTASFDEGSSVTLVPAANAGSQFAGWTGACTGTGACTVAMTAAQAVTASFTPTQYALTVMLTGAGGGTVTSNLTGINCGSDCAQGYPVNTIVTLTAVASTTSDFIAWGGACAGVSTCVVTMDQAKDVTATFDLEHNALTVSGAGTGSGTVTSSPAGISCGSDCTEIYPGNQSVTLTATAASGSVFTGWSGTCSSSTTNKCTLSMAQAVSVTATFEVPQTLTVLKDGTGTGTVTSSTTGINCGATCTATMVGTVTLTATAAAGSGLVKWTGCTSTSTNTCTVKMLTAKTITASFGTLRTLTVTRTGSGSGTVSTTPSSAIICGSSCTATFPEGVTVQLGASPLSGFAFAGWGGACAGTVTTCSLVIDANKTVSAGFEPTQTLTVTRSGNGTGTVTSTPSGIACGATCTAGFANNLVVALSAVAQAGSHFAGWTGACTGTGACQVTMNAGKSVAATFSSP